MVDPLPSYLRKSFRMIFGRPINEFWHPLMGFDVVKFDKWLKVKPGVSTAQHVEKKFGKRGLNVCQILLNIEGIKL